MANLYIWRFHQQSDVIFAARCRRDNRFEDITVYAGVTETVVTMTTKNTCELTNQTLNLIPAITPTVLLNITQQGLGKAGSEGKGQLTP